MSLLGHGLRGGNKQNSLASRGTPTHTSQRQVLRIQYENLSATIAEPHLSSSHGSNGPARRQQVVNLIRNEKDYEALLLKETRFPKADETNREVLSWVELVMKNWRILCGPGWTDEDLGSGGKVAAGRRTLDILYRAATKTFHSTQILRHLFTIHTFLGEFSLAFKAFDTYIELVGKGRARAAKSGETNESLDDDATALRSAAEAVKIACRFGSIIFAEKALTIGTLIEDWISQGQDGSMSNGDLRHTTQPEQGTGAMASSRLPKEVLTIAYHAVGISQANWALNHYDAAIRTEFQQKGVQSLHKSLEVGGANLESPETLFALGYVLADMRRIPEATIVVKRALQAAQTPAIDHNGTYSNAFVNERRLLAVWHLLGLLLSTEDEYEKAEACCEAAFDQFRNPVNLFGLDPEFRIKDATLLADGASNSSERGIVDDMDDYEKQNMIELKLTHMALLEETEGPEAAVNESDELVALYLRLYGPVHFESGINSNHLDTQSTNRNTFDGARSTDERFSKEFRRDHSFSSTTHQHSNTMQPPAIEITNEKGALAPGSHSHSRNHAQNGVHGHRHFGSLRSKAFGSTRKSRASVESRRTVGEKKPGQEFGLDGNSYSHTNGQRLDNPAHNMAAEKLPEPIGNATHALQQDTRLPVPHPHAQHSSASNFLILQRTRHQVSILVKIWLSIARLYTEALMSSDAKEALYEAYKLVENLELELSRNDSSAEVFKDRGWGDTRSIEELWADVYTKRGFLLQSQSQPHDALQNFEKALSHAPDHREATVALSAILLDIYEQIIPPERVENSYGSTSTASASTTNQSPSASTGSTNSTIHNNSQILTANPSPRELSRLAARDRAYGLLTTLTKLPSGWHDSEAWLTLARAYELSGQVDKAKEALWWTVELENAKPARPWAEVGPGGLVL